MNLNTREFRAMTITEKLHTVTEDCVGKKYITPHHMSAILHCNMYDLMWALEQHKRALPTDMLCCGNYGNCNYVVQPEDKVYYQGWINFLSLKCFSDSKEAKVVADILNAEEKTKDIKITIRTEKVEEPKKISEDQRQEVPEPKNKKVYPDRDYTKQELAAMFRELEGQYNPYPIAASFNDIFSAALHDNVISERTYHMAYNAFERTWYMGD